MLFNRFRVRKHFELSILTVLCSTVKLHRGFMEVNDCVVDLFLLIFFTFKIALLRLKVDLNYLDIRLTIDVDGIYEYDSNYVNAFFNVVFFLLLFYRWHTLQYLPLW